VGGCFGDVCVCGWVGVLVTCVCFGDVCVCVCVCVGGCFGDMCVCARARACVCMCGCFSNVYVGVWGRFGNVCV